MLLDESYQKGRTAAMLEAAAALHVSDTVQYHCLKNSADFMRQRSEEIRKLTIKRKD